MANVNPNSPDAPFTLTFMGPRVSQGASSDSPAYITSACEWMETRSRVCRDLRAGTARMIAKADQYLPRYPTEEEADYQLRLRFASLRNYYAQAVNTILGKIFTQPPTLNDDVPAPIAKHMEDADLNGNHWSIVAEKYMDAALDQGISWLVIDYHTVEGVSEGKVLTLRDEIEMGVRPYWVVIPQHRVLGVKYRYEKGRYTLTQFRYWTQVVEDDGAFGEKTIDEIRVIEPNDFHTYRKDETTGNWILQEGLKRNTLGMVAAVPLNLNETGHYEATPPLENLAYMNLEHFQIRSDQRRALSVASFPIFATFGVDAKAGAAQIGPLTSLAFEEEKANAKWVESNGVHLRAGADELERLENQMRTFGLSFENPGMYATATGRNIDASDAVAPIVRWAYRLRDAINIALWYHAKWMRKSSGGTIDVNTTFLRNMITVEGLKLLLEAMKEGKLTPEAFLNRMKDYGLLGDDFDTKAEVKAQAREAKRIAEDALRVANEALDAPPGDSSDDD